MASERTRFDCTPEQYHAGLDMLWPAIGNDLGEHATVWHATVAEIERLRSVYDAVTNYRRKEREILGLPEDAREEDHLAKMRRIMTQHREIDQAYQVAADGKAYWKATSETLKAELAERDKPCVWCYDSHHEYWQASCDASAAYLFTEPKVPEHYVFCPNCGHPIQGA